MDAAIQKANGKKVLGSVPEAENLIVTSDHRWFASGSDGLYQIDPDGVTPPQKIPIAFDAHAPPSTDKRSFFLGITQYRHFIYATCTPDPDNAASPRYIMLMDMTQSLASMAAIHQIFDPVDIELVDGGLVITQAGLIDSLDPATFHYSTFNKVIHISESGRELHSSDVRLSPPSAVKLVPDSVAPSPDLIITERTGDVIRLSQEWGLKPRH